MAVNWLIISHSVHSLDYFQLPVKKKKCLIGCLTSICMQCAKPFTKIMALSYQLLDLLITFTLSFPLGRCVHFVKTLSVVCHVFV